MKQSIFLDLADMLGFEQANRFVQGEPLTNTGHEHHEPAHQEPICPAPIVDCGSPDVSWGMGFNHFGGGGCGGCGGFGDGF